MSINNNTGYVTICIPNTRFMISYKPVDFDIIYFLKLLDIKLDQYDKQILSDHQLFELAKDSFKYDNKILGYSEYQDIYQFLNNNPHIPLLKYVYQNIKSMENFFIDDFQNIKNQNKDKFVQVKYDKINSQKLSEEEIQNLNKLPFYMGYIFYMFYERLHPKPDFNGIIGRMLFVQNYSFRNYFPISKFLCDVECSYVDDIYKIFSFPQKIDTQNDQVDLNDQQDYNLNMKKIEDNCRYFSITLDKEAVSKIILILLFSIIYHQHQNDDSKTKQLLLEYFQDPFKRNPRLNFIFIANSMYIGKMINELNWNQKDNNEFSS